MKDIYEQSEHSKSKRASFSSVFTFGFVALGLALFFARLFFTVDYYDEFFNTTIAYQTVLGQTFLSDIWNYFQTGDAIQIPFLWLFRTVFGSLDGVIIAGRINYFLCCCVIGLIAYRTFRWEKNIAMFAAAMIVCYAPFSLSYWWYDTVMIQFSLLGCLFLLRAMDSEKASQKRTNLIVAGLCHAWMVFSYPFSVLVVIFLAVYLSIRKKSFKPTLWYLLGTLILFGAFCIYCAGIGFENLFFFRQSQVTASSGAITSGLSGRSYLLDASGYYTRISKSVDAIIQKHLKQLLALIVSGVLLLGFYMARNWKLCLGILLAQPFIPTLISIEFNAHATVFFWAYFFMFGFFCWLILRTTEEKRHADQIFSVLWVPSLLVFCAITLTALGDANTKGMVGLYCGALCGFLFYLMVIRLILRNLSISVSKFLLSLAGLALLFGEVLLYCASSYRSVHARQCDYVIKTGVCKGIVTVQADASYETLEKELDSLIVSSDRTILTLDRAAYIYLMSDLKMAAPTPSGWSETYEYWDQVSGMPDIIVGLTDQLNEKSERIQGIINDNYTRIGTAGAFSVYRINTPGEVLAFTDMTFQE